MLTLTVVNDGTGEREPHPGLAYYDYVVAVNGKTLASGKVQHWREAGWPVLLATVILAVMAKGTLSGTVRQKTFRQPRRVKT